jgi:hypothetical protein
MDQFRNLRFVVAPSLFLGGLLIGAWYDGSIVVYFRSLTTAQVTAIGGVVAAAIVPVGFAIGSLTLLILYALWRLPWAKDHFQASMSEEAWERAWMSFGKNPPRRETQLDKLAGAAIFVRVSIEPKVEEFLDRRSQAFHTSLNSCVALILSWCVGLYLIGLKPTYQWLITTDVAFLIFLVLAKLNWLELMKVLEFIALLPPNRRVRPRNEQDGAE